jgi:hypothetical protein
MVVAQPLFRRCRDSTVRRPILSAPFVIDLGFERPELRQRGHQDGLLMSLKLLPLDNLRETLEWYEKNLCDVELRDPRGYRVRFKSEHFIHHIKLTTKFGKEPKNRTLTIEEIRADRIQFVSGRFSVQRASEIPWPVELATKPECICLNWQGMGTGDENYVRNFGTEDQPQWRVLVCKIIGQTRHFSTLMPCEIKEKYLANKIWP